MKKRVTGIGLVQLMIGMLAGTISAQPTVTGTVCNYKVGNSYDVHQYDHDNFNPGSGGANVTWDFSGVSSTGQETWEIQAPYDSTYATGDKLSVSLDPEKRHYFDARNGERIT